MKKVFIMIAALSITLFADEPSFTIKEARNLQAEELQAILAGEDTQSIIKFSSGDTFPLNLGYQSEFFSLNIPEDVPYSVSIKRNFFVRFIEKENALFSLDGKTWKTFIEIATGSFRVGFAVDEKSPEPIVSIGGHLVERIQPEEGGDSSY